MNLYLLSASGCGLSEGSSYSLGGGILHVTLLCNFFQHHMHTDFIKIILVADAYHIARISSIHTGQQMLCISVSRPRCLGR